MSTQIDNRIVSMQFKDDGFTNGASSAMTTLSKLAGQIPAQGISNKIEKSLNNVDFSKLDDDVGKISNRFTLFGDLAFQAIQKINTAILNLGTKFASTFITGPINQGFHEYETKMKAITTITTNTAQEGVTNKQIKDALEELNEYADKTIYNFAQMTDNIGKFTAAGVKFDDAVPAIQGIANWAATAGSNAQQASVAMYQLSQSLATGSLKLQDWNSVVNAGMGGKSMQKMLMDVAEKKAISEMEALKKQGLWNPDEGGASRKVADVLSSLKKIQSGSSDFRSELKKGLISSDALIESLNILAGTYTEADLISMGYSKKKAKEFIDMQKRAEDAATKVRTFTQLLDTVGESIGSVWANVWEAIFGDYDQATETFTKISKAIDKFNQAWGDGLVGFLRQWNELGGRAHLLSAIGTIIKGIGGALKPVVDGFNSLFPKDLAKQAANLSKSFDAFVKSIHIPDYIKEGWKWVWDLSAHVASLKSFAKAIADFAVALSKVRSLNDLVVLLGDTFDKIKSKAISLIPDNAIKNIDKFKDSTQKLLREIVVPKGVKNLWETVLPIGSVIVGSIKTFITYVNNILHSSKSLSNAKKYVSDFYQGFKTFASGTVLSVITGSISTFTKSFGDLVNKFKTNYIPNGLSAISKAFNIFGNTAKKIVGMFKSGDYTSIIKIGENIYNGIKNAFTKLIGYLGDIKITNIVGPVVDVFNNINHAFKNGSEKLNPSRYVAKFDGIAKAIASIPKSITDGVVILKETIDKYVKIATELPVISGGVSIVVTAINDAFETVATSFMRLGAVGGTAMTVASIGIAVLIAGVISIIRLVNSVGKYINSKAIANKADAFKDLAIGMLLLSVALVSISKIKDSDAMLSATKTMAAIFIAMVAATVIISKAKVPQEAEITKKLLIIAVLASSVKSLTKALGKISGESTEGLITGTIAIGALMFALAELLRIIINMPYANNMVGKVVGLLGISEAMRLLIKPVKSLGAFGKSDIVGLGIGLACIGILGEIMASFSQIEKSSVSTGINMLVMAVAIGSLVKTMNVIKDVSFTDLVKSMGVVMSLMSALTYFSKELGGNGGSMVALTAGLIGVGVAMTLFAGAMNIIKGVDADTILGSIVTLIVAIGSLIYAVNSIQGNVLNIAAVTVGFVGLAVGLTVLSIAMRTMQDVDPNTIAVSLGTLIVSLVAFVATANALNGIIPGVIAASVGLIGFSIALNVFAKGVSAMQDISFMDVIKSIGGFAIAIITLGALAVIISNFAIQLVIGAAAIAAFGASLGVVGVGLSLLTRGMIEFGSLMSNIINGILDELESLINGFKSLLGLPVDASNSGNSTIHSYGDAIHGGSEYAFEAADDVRTGVQDKLKLNPEDGKFNAEEYLLGLSSGFEGGQNDLGDITGGIGDNIYDSIFGENGSLNPQLTYEGALSSMSGLSTGLTEGNVDVAEVLNNVTSGINSDLDVENLIPNGTGEEVMRYLASGLSNGSDTPINVVDKTVDGMSKKITNSKQEAKSAAKDWVTNGVGVGLQNGTGTIERKSENLVKLMVNKLKNGRGSAKDAGKGLANAAAEGIGGNTGFTVAGANAAKGFANGIENNAHLAAAAGRTLGQRALTAMERKLDEHSPSKETFKIGKFFVDGFVNGIDRLGYKAANSAAEVGTKAMNTLTKSFQSAKMNLDDVKITTKDLLDYDPNPVITPVVDTANLAALDNLTATVNGAAINDLAGFVDSVKPRQDAAPINNTTTNNNYNFTQTNNSPKALSRFDIYKQTQMQFATAVGAV